MMSRWDWRVVATSISGFWNKHFVVVVVVVNFVWCTRVCGLQSVWCSKCSDL